MTGAAAGDPDEGTGAPSGPSLPEGPIGGLATLIALGVVLRLIILAALPGSGFGVDLDAFRYWAADLAAHGPFGFYERGFFADYTPGYLYLLWLVGAIGSLLGGIGDLIKVPAVAADLVIAWLIHSMALELGATRRRALLAAGLFLLFPLSWFDSVVWGQVDSVGIAVLLLAVREIWRERPVRAAILATVAAVIKPQLGILVPILVAWMVGRILRERDEGAGGARAGLLAAGVAGVAAIATATLLSAPFGLSLLGLLRQVGSAAAGYPYVTVNAFNPWALVSLDGHGIIADGTWVNDITVGGVTGASFGPLPALAIGTTLLVTAIVLIGSVVVRRPTRETVLVALAVLAVAFFVLPTRVHERYLYPFIPLGAILLARWSRWTVPWLVAATAMTLSMYVVLTTIYPDNPRIADWLGIGPALRTAPAVVALALAHAGLLAWGVLRLRVRELEALEPSGAATAWFADRSDPTGPMRGRAPWRHPRFAADDDGLPARLWRRLSAPPIRGDRSVELAAEPGGRLDRLDLWVVVVLAIALLGLRTYRLELPYQMHFDEVYHPRTAAEFLQDWRYDQPHAIYEFTHPHLAKYAMAAGLVLFADDRVRGTSELGTTVVASAIEARWDDPRLPNGRGGDRLYVATGSEVRALDLHTRALVATLAVPGAISVAVGADRHELFVGTVDGGVLGLDTGLLDELRIGGTAPGADLLRNVARLEGPVEHLFVSADGNDVAAIVAGGTFVTIEPDTGELLGRVELPGASGIADAGSASSFVVHPSLVPDPVAAADTLAAILGGLPDDYADTLASSADPVVVAPLPSGDVRNAVEAAIEDGRLAGFELATTPLIAVGTTQGVALVDPLGTTVTQRLPTTSPVTGLAAVTGLDVPYVYAAAGRSLVVVALPKAGETGTPRISTTLKMPGRVEDVAWDRSSLMVHVLGWTPEATTGTSDGTAAAPVPAPAPGPTVYVVEPHGNAVYADARLPFEPAAWTLDVAPGYPDDERQELLAFSGDGTVASVDIGRHAFAWRLPGVLAGVLTAILLYLLARLLFRRRSVAVLAAVFAGLDGMLFVQSRIGMNDAYVGLLIVAAYLVFAGLWTGRWGGRAFWLLMPVVGLLLGLALASKWVALYAIGGLGVLVLARSALGRLLLVVGLLAATAVLGYLAMSVPAGGTSGGNLTFMLVMIVLTLAAIVVSILHPIAWSLEEVRFAIGAPLAAGLAILIVGFPLGLIGGPAACDPITGACSDRRLLEVAFGLIALSGALFVGLRILGRVGWGPLAPSRVGAARRLPPAEPAPIGWLRPGWAYGLPALWLVLSLVAIPLAVYIASYLPWVALGNRLTESWPPGNTGQTLGQLTASMYGYHNDLRAPHAASSPWWAWPLDLKPVWFYQGSFASGTAGAIYDAGNLVLWWLGIPAMAFTSWVAFRRRSLGMALVVIAFLCQWIPWARIDRATFQYHYYTSVPFLLLALAIFVAELWHGATRRTWLFARVAAALAVLGPILLWLVRLPLCGWVRVETVNAGSQACAVLPPGQILLTARTAGLVLVLLVGLALIARSVLAMEREAAAGHEDGEAGPLAPRRGRESDGLLARLGLAEGFGRIALVAVGAGAGVVLASRLLPESELLRIDGFPPEAVALLLLVPVTPLAWIVLTARDARRFVAGLVLAALVWFVLWYPNLTGLAVPTPFVNAYQGVLPTYLWPFQFPVNTDPAGALPTFATSEFLILVAALVVTSISVGLSAASWRSATTGAGWIPASELALPGVGEPPMGERPAPPEPPRTTSDGPFV